MSKVYGSTDDEYVVEIKHDSLLQQIEEQTELEDGRWPNATLVLLKEAVELVVMGLAAPDDPATGPLGVLQARAKFLAEYFEAHTISFQELINDRKRTAYVEIRNQHSVGSSKGNFGGPDTYVAVQVVPEGIVPLVCLNRSIARAQGIEIKYFGEGYKKNSGPRSMLGRALAEAEEYANKINREVK